MPSACGGGGTCGQCRVRVLSGGGAILPTETSIINKRDAADHYRLSCQVAVKQDMDVQVPDEVFGVKRYECTVVSNRNVASFIKELVVACPRAKNSSSGQAATSRSNARHTTSSTRISTSTKRFRDEWDRYNLWRTSRT